MSDAITVKLNLPKGPDHYWKIMVQRTKEAGGFTVTDIFKSSNGVTRRAIWTYVEGCEREGFVERVGAQDDRSAVFRVTRPATTPKIPKTSGKKGLIRQALWTAIRVMGPFQLRELALTASTDEIEVSFKTATRFICQLRQAGVVELLDDGGKYKPSTFRLKPTANSGPLPPQILNAQFVFDPNKQKVVGEAAASEVLS